MRTVISGVWLNVSEGAELRCTMQGSNEASVTIGESSIEHEMNFDYVSFKSFVVQANNVLGQTEAKADEEEAEWEAEQARRTATDPSQQAVALS